MGETRWFALRNQNRPKHSDQTRDLFMETCCHVNHCKNLYIHELSVPEPNIVMTTVQDSSATFCPLPLLFLLFHSNYFSLSWIEREDGPLFEKNNPWPVEDPGFPRRGGGGQSILFRQFLKSENWMKLKNNWTKRGRVLGIPFRSALHDLFVLKHNANQTVAILHVWFDA